MESLYFKLDYIKTIQNFLRLAAPTSQDQWQQS